MDDLITTTENACALLAYDACVSGSVSNVTVYKGQDNERKQAPAIICNVESAPEIYPDTGLCKVKADIIVKQIAADTDVADRGIIPGVIWRAFLNPNTINNLINQVPNYSVIAIYKLDEFKDEQGDVWVKTLSLEIVCALTN